MRILGIEREQGACNHYRIVQPLYKMKQHRLADVLTIHPQNGEDLEFVQAKILEADLVFFQRPADDRWLNMLRAIQKAGKIIVVDYDDNPFETSPFNPSYQYYGTKEYKYRYPDGREKVLWQNGDNGFDIEANITRLDYFKASFKQADMVSASTPVLQEVFKKLNPNTVVLPNLIDFDLFPRLDFVKKEIRIGWQGGYSHYEDLFMVAPAIKAILKKHKNTKFIYFGDARLLSPFRGIPEDQIEAHPWVQRVAYPLKLATLNLDIGLCPIVDNVFNRCKSAIKYFEYSALGVASIASDIKPYSPAIDHGINGLLTKPDTWFDSIESLVCNEQSRNRMAYESYQNVFEFHNADKNAHLWMDAFKSTLEFDITKVGI